MSKKSVTPAYRYRYKFLIEKKDTEILITPKGKQLLELVPQDLKKPELTAQWEIKVPQGHAASAYAP